MSYRSLLRVAGVGFFPLGFLARLPYATSALSTLILLQAATHSYAFAGLAGAAQSFAIAIGGPLVGATLLCNVPGRAPTGRKSGGTGAPRR